MYGPKLKKDGKILFQRKGNGECRALFELAFDIDRTVVDLGDRLGDIESQSDPGLAVSRPVKAPKDIFHILGGYSRSGIFNADLDVIFMGHNMDFYSASIRGKFDGVVQ